MYFLAYCSYVFRKKTDKIVDCLIKQDDISYQLFFEFSKDISTTEWQLCKKITFRKIPNDSTLNAILLYDGDQDFKIQSLEKGFVTINKNLTRIYCYQDAIYICNRGYIGKEKNQHIYDEDAALYSQGFDENSISVRNDVIFVEKNPNKKFVIKGSNQDTINLMTIEYNELLYLQEQAKNQIFSRYEQEQNDLEFQAINAEIFRRDKDKSNKEITEIINPQNKKLKKKLISVLVIFGSGLITTFLILLYRIDKKKNQKSDCL